MSPTPLEQSVVKTLAWFALSNYPVTAFEVWKWMIEPERKYDLSEVCRVLDESTWLNQKLQCNDGHYVLCGTQKIQGQIAGRRARFLDAVRKFRVLRRATQFIQLVPGVQSVAAVNTLSWWFTTSESDIDLFIITKPNHIWLTRLLLVTPFALMKRRPHEGLQDPFCFSFFVTREALQLESLKLGHDYYLAFWCKTIVPMINHQGDFERFSDENRWVDQMLPHAHMRAPHPYHHFGRLRSFPFSLAPLNTLSRSFQRRRMPDSLKEIANQDSRVVVTDDMLKFHQNDRREKFCNQFQALLDKYL